LTGFHLKFHKKSTNINFQSFLQLTSLQQRVSYPTTRKGFPNCGWTKTIYNLHTHTPSFSIPLKPSMDYYATISHTKTFESLIEVASSPKFFLYSTYYSNPEGSANISNNFKHEFSYRKFSSSLLNK